MQTKRIIVSMFCLFLVASAYAADNTISLNITPPRLEIDSFYNGSLLTVSGSVPADSQAVLRFTSAPSDIHLRERGKVFGLMWMNLDSLIFKGAPDVCIIGSPFSFDDSSDQAASAVNALGLPGIKDMVRIETGGMEQGKAFDEFIKLKKNEGLYREIMLTIEYGPATNGQKSFRTEIPLPSRLSPGTYSVEVAAVDKDRIIAKTGRQFTARLVGFPAFLARLAFDHGALYGILASIIAILAGLAIGLVFQSGEAH